MRWTKLLAIALVINIHTSGCIGGLLSVSAAMAASLSSYEMDDSMVMTIAQPEDFLCTNQSLVRSEESTEVADSSDEGGCSSDSCLDRSHQDRKERNLLVDLVEVTDEVSFVQFEFINTEPTLLHELFTQRDPPLFEHASEHVRSLAKRE